MRPFCSLLLGLFVCLSLSSFVLRLEEFGKAGYYADALQGRKTASGEKYDKDVLTCAHKTYAFGTRLRVTRLDNKKSVIVRVNDRGPFTEGFVVDLSRAAAREIDLIKAGRANVKVEVVEAERNTPDGTQRVPTAAASTERGTSAAAATTAKPRTVLLKSQQKAAPAVKPAVKPAVRPVTYSRADPVPATVQRPKSVTTYAATTTELYKVDLRNLVKTGFGVQVSTIYDADNVMPMVTKLQTQFPGKVLVSVERDDASDQSTYRIIVGPYPTRKAAENQQKVAERKGNKKCFVVDLSAI